jgi:hypothetical protein
LLLRQTTIASWNVCGSALILKPLRNSGSDPALSVIIGSLPQQCDSATYATFSNLWRSRRQMFSLPGSPTSVSRVGRYTVFTACAPHCICEARHSTSLRSRNWSADSEPVLEDSGDPHEWETIAVYHHPIAFEDDNQFTFRAQEIHTNRLRIRDLLRFRDFEKGHIVQIVADVVPSAAGGRFRDLLAVHPGSWNC